MVTREDEQVKQKSSVTRHIPSMLTDSDDVTINYILLVSFINTIQKSMN